MARGQRRGKLSNPLFTPEYYEKRRQKFAKGPRVKVIHTNSTKIGLDRIDKKWQVYCLYIGQDPHDTLEECSAEIFENFLHWILNGSEVKRSILETYWKFLNLHYTKQTGRPVDKLVAKEIQVCIRDSLTVDTT